MKKLLERLAEDSDRKKLLISICAVTVVVIAAMLIPLAFRAAPGGSGGSEPLPLSLEERSQMFADYWTLGAEAGGFTVEKPDPVPKKMKETCETVIRTVIARSIDDQALTDPTPTGAEYTVITDAEGRELHLCRMWLEKRGDWQNWLDVCMDAETGELYYFYLSRECLTNRKNYASPEVTEPAQIAELIANESGWTLRYLALEEDDSAAAVYSTPGGTLCFAISSRVYDALIDVKIGCR